MEEDVVFYPQDLWGDLTGWGAGAYQQAQGVVGAAIQQVQGVVSQGQQAVQAFGGQIEQQYVAPAVQIVQQYAAPVVQEVGTVTQQAEQVVGGAISVAQQTPQIIEAGAQQVASGIVSSGQFQEQLAQAAAGAIMGGGIAGVAAAAAGGAEAAGEAVLSALSQIIPPPVSAAPVISGPTPVFISGAATLVSPPVPLAETPGGALGLLYSAGAELVGGVAQQVPEFWDIGWNTGVGQSAANAVYNAGVQTKNVFNNIVSGKPLTEGILTGTIVRSADQGPSNLAGETTKTVINTIQNTTGVKVEEKPITALVQPYATAELQSGNIGIRGLGLVTYFGGSVADWMLGHPALAAAPTATLPIALTEVVEKISQPGAAVKMGGGFGDLGTLVVGGKEALIQKKTAAAAATRVPKRTVVSYKSQCWDQPIGTAGCP